MNLPCVGAQIGSKRKIMRIACLITLLLSAFAAISAEQKKFPAHWGNPPAVQTKDLRPLPGGYGYGSSTLAKWIEQNLEKDRQAAQSKTNANSIEKPNDIQNKFTPQERKAIEEYMAQYRKKADGKANNPKNLPPELSNTITSNADLPPGWRTKLNAGEILPEKVMQQARPLPAEIKLPSPPKGTTNVVLEGKALRVLEKSRQILDVLELNK